MFESVRESKLLPLLTSHIKGRRIGGRDVGHADSTGDCEHESHVLNIWLADGAREDAHSSSEVESTVH